MGAYWERATKTRSLSFCNVLHLRSLCAMLKRVLSTATRMVASRLFLSFSFNFGGGIKAGDVPAVHATRRVSHVAYSLDDSVAITVHPTLRGSFKLGVPSLQPLERRCNVLRCLLVLRESCLRDYLLYRVIFVLLGDVSQSSPVGPVQTELAAESHKSIVFAKGSAEA